VRWTCREHRVEISVEEETPDEVLDDLPPVCPVCENPMERKLVGVTKKDIKRAVAEEADLGEDDVAKGFWKGVGTNDPFKKEGWFKLAKALGIGRELGQGGT
jgi:hypothetical protein